MSEEIMLLLRHRVATRYYDQPHVIDALARVLLAARHAHGPRIAPDELADRSRAKP